MKGKNSCCVKTRKQGSLSRARAIIEEDEDTKGRKRGSNCAKSPKAVVGFQFKVESDGWSGGAGTTKPPSITVDKGATMTDEPFAVEAR